MDAEKFYRGLIEEAKRATPEQRERGKALTERFVWSRLSKAQRKRWEEEKRKEWMDTVLSVGK